MLRNRAAPAAPAAPVAPATPEVKWINLLPPVPAVTTINFCDKLPCRGGIPKPSPVTALGLERKELEECFLVKEKDFPGLHQERNSDGTLKSDLSPEEFERDVKAFYENAFFCKNECGVTVGVLPGKILPPIFQPVTGELIPSAEFKSAHNNPHCSLYEDQKGVMGVINPLQRGGALDLTNHTFTVEKKREFLTVDPEVESYAATPTFVRMTRWINGYRIEGLGNPEPIKGGVNGTFIYWDYACADEYLAANPDYGSKKGLTDFNNVLVERPVKDLFLFDTRPEHSGAVIDPSKYQLATFSIRVGSTSRSLVLTGGAVYFWRLAEFEPDKCLALKSPFSAQIIPVPYKMLQQFAKDFVAGRRPFLREPQPVMAGGLGQHGSFRAGAATGPAAPAAPGTTGPANDGFCVTM